jgi:hypothetical protein
MQTVRFRQKSNPLVDTIHTGSSMMARCGVLQRAKNQKSFKASSFPPGQKRQAPVYEE